MNNLAEVILPPIETEPELPEEQLPEVEKPTEQSKVISVNFSPLNTKQTASLDTHESFFTTDSDAWIVLNVGDMNEPTGQYSLALINKEDGSIFQHVGDIVQGVAYYKLLPNEIKHAGRWVGQAVITLANGQTTASRFSFNVSGHILDGKDVREIVIQDFQTLMKQLNDLKNNAGVDIEVLKNNVEETNRLASENELLRVEAENERVVSYDSKVDSAIVEADVVTKVDNKVAELSPTIQNVTAQLAQKASVAEVNTLSTNKADLTYVDTKISNVKDGSVKGAYATLVNLTTAHPMGNSNIYVVINDGNWYYWNGSVWTSGGQYISKGSIIAPLTNLVTNGDFSNGTTGWSISTATTVSVSDNELTFIATGKFGRAFTSISYNDNDIIYRSAYVKANSHLVVLGASSNVLNAHSGSGNYERLSHIGVWNASKHISVVDTRESGWDNVSIKNMIAINLTKIFGVGNIPSLEQIDTFLSVFPNRWFDGTVNGLDGKVALIGEVAKETENILKTEGAIKPFNLSSDIKDLFHQRYENFSIANVDGFIDKNTGNLETSVTGYLTKVVPVEYGDEFLVSTHANGAGLAVVSFFKGNAFVGVHTAGLSVSPFQITVEVTIPYGVDVMKLSSGIGGTFRVSQNTYYKPDVTGSKLSRKSSLFIGDSIVAALNTSGGFVSYIGESNEMDYLNAGIGGTTLAKRDTRTDSIVERITTYGANYDYVILEGGINDVLNSLPLGSMTSGFNDTYDVTTFCGSLESIIRQSKLKWKDAKIGFILIHRLSNAGRFAKQKQYFNVAIEIFNKWSIPYCDLFNQSTLSSGITELNNYYFLNGDMLHPNDVGYEVGYNSKIEAWMRTL